MTDQTRRAFVGTLGGAVGVGLAGCTGLSAGDPAGGNGGSWNTFGFDAANTSHSPGAAGPAEQPSVQQEFNVGYTMTRSSPVVVDGSLYVGTHDNSLLALSVEDGEERWDQNMHTDKVHATAAVVDGRAFVRHRTSVYAYDADSGDQQWQFDADNGEHDDERRSSPTVVDGTVYATCNDGVLYALSAEDGSEQWRFDVGGEVRTPAVVDDTVYASGDGLYALNASDGSEQWSVDLPSDAAAAPAVADGTVFSGHGDGVAAVSTADGSVEWTEETDHRVVGVSVADGTAYVASGQGIVAAHDADSGELRWSHEVPGTTVWPAAVAGGRVYHAGSEGTVTALSPDDGAIEWEFEPEYAASAAPAVVGDRLFLRAYGGRVLVLGA